MQIARIQKEDSFPAVEMDLRVFHTNNAAQAIVSFTAILIKINYYINFYFLSL